MHPNDVSGHVVDAAIRLHSRLGPGLLESVYEKCLAYEIGKQGLSVVSQVGLPVVYDDVRIDLGYRLDLIVESVVVVEIKAVEQVHPTHKAQLLSYVRLSGHKIGLLLNFNVELMKDGIFRVVNRL